MWRAACAIAKTTAAALTGGMRLLLVEDTPKLSELLVKQLTERGYAVDAVADAASAREALRLAAYDLILLDLGLPDEDGRALLQSLRRQGVSIAVLVATARTDLGQRVQTLDDGADDYLMKPFSPEELAARVRALLRRPRHTLGSVLTVGNLAIDTTRLSVSIDGVTVDMTRREVTVLTTLLRGEGRLVSRRALEDAVYSFDAEVTPNAMDAAVSRVRRKLAQHGASVVLTTMRGLGYILAERT